MVGGCDQRDVKRYTLSFHNGFVANPLLPGFVQFWQVDYLTPMQLDAGFNTTALGIHEWGFLFGLMLVVFLLEEARKRFFVRRRRPRFETI